jgi:pyruvate dehydrogenase E2 component (dihydrolipoamide acetyltransferase)
MATEIFLSKLSPTMEEGQLSKWLKKEGDAIAMGEPIAEVETDKAAMEMAALNSGTLLKILVHEGESVPLGHTIGIMGEPGEDISSLIEKFSSASSSTPTEEKKETASTTNGASATQTAVVTETVPIQTDGRLLVTPIAARMATEAEIDLRSIKGSGPSGRIIKRDIEAAMKSKQETPTPKPIQLPAIEGTSAFRDVPTTEIRKVIARRLVTSIGPVPHFFLTTEIEMDKALDARRSLNEIDPENKISVNDLIVKVVANALLQHPQVNASFQEKSIRYYERADIGVAVAIEDGLITPIIRSADKKGIGQIAREVKEMAARAREKKLRPEEYTGATFSVSNLGMFGIDDFTAVINPPEAAILAVGASVAKPVVRDNEIVVRQMMRVTMSCDHRVIDGATGAKFLQTLKKMLENPMMLIY